MGLVACGHTVAWVEIFRFDRAERAISAHGSVGFTATRVASGDGSLTVTHLTVEPGGTIGTHPATSAQVFLVVSGSGWVAGPDGARVPVSAGDGVRWEAGEVHTSGTDTGFTAFDVSALSLSLFETEPEGA